jgi:aryl-alcohol dehydrogenase-like predicted oxidoreductase
MGGVFVELRNLGHSGLSVSTVGLGCNNFGKRVDQATAEAVVLRAIDSGITLFDTADVYGDKGGSEEALGRILGERRQRIVLATKFGLPMDEAGTLKGGSRRYVMRAIEASLRRLKTDWIDLYQMHRPDPTTPIEETMHALDDLVRQGKVRYVGCSNFAPWQAVDAQWTARSAHRTPFVSSQDEYSLVVRDLDKEAIPAMRAHGLGLLPYFPLACGLLTGKYRRGAQVPPGTRFSLMPQLADRYLSEANFTKVERLTTFAEERGHTLLDLAFSWLLARAPVASVIAGATRPEQIEQNVRAASWKLTDADLAEIDRITLPPGEAP